MTLSWRANTIEEGTSAESPLPSIRHVNNNNDNIMRDPAAVGCYVEMLLRSLFPNSLVIQHFNLSSRHSQVCSSRLANPTIGDIVVLHPTLSLSMPLQQPPASQTLQPSKKTEEKTSEQKAKEQAVARTRTWDLSHLMSCDSPKRES